MIKVRGPAALAQSVRRVMQCVNHGPGCGCPAHNSTPATPKDVILTGKLLQSTTVGQPIRYATTAIPQKEYAFEMASSNIRFGDNATSEIGMDALNLKAKKVIVITDKNIAKLRPAKAVVESLERHGVQYQVFDQVSCEPTDTSFKLAIDFSKKYQPDLFIAVGGGSVMDTAKAANLYFCYPEADFLDFVNAPIGKGRVIDKALKPLIAVPTTAGTGSETTGTSIFDYEPLKTKTGIAHRALKPLLGIVDPLNTRSMPPNVHAASGLDVLCHSLESYTAIPYSERTPRPKNPIERPAYQGSNPISDIWSIHALRMTVKYLPRAFRNPEDIDAQRNMLLAATYAGVGFGNAGVHLCHGMSYPISGLNKGYQHPQYEATGHGIVPHGVSVAVTSPAVFEFTAPACPERHLEAAEIFGKDISRVKKEDAGLVLGDALREFLAELKIPNGLKAFGFGSSDLDALVKGTLPQHRVTKLAPIPAEAESLHRMFEKSLTIY
ncbi:hypothetical protein DSO57_1020336 [Entomophthora muscae]|uniref:Uncharacterized protein n=1 Tax=Entomophthora muscae TaxID=34485 RepID=A0ACC2T3I9_9FUNG|nr:hypothetical protein DSO57_1020336 [Entomophthora muscae]